MNASLPELFASVIKCQECPAHSPLLRDECENVPQPGFVGSNYREKRVLLVGQNPGLPSPALAGPDTVYTAALRCVRATPTEESYAGLQNTLRAFVPTWPVHGRYFPLAEAGLSLDDIAYCNVVRCRTLANAKPTKAMASTCARTHFAAWLDELKPRVVVFVGLWAFQQAGEEVQRRGLLCDFINRSRSLSRAERAANRERVVKLLRAVSG